MWIGPEHIVIAVLFLIAMCFVCFAMGWGFAIKDLLIGAKSKSRTPHKLEGEFWYVVPEKEYCEMSQAALRHGRADATGTATFTGNLD